MAIPSQKNHCLQDKLFEKPLPPKTKLKLKKEAEIDAAIKNAIKQVAIANKVDTVVEKTVVFFGGIDLTDKVVKQLNSGSVK